MNNDKTVTNSLIVEGWRFIGHSYAIVNQWQLLAFLRRPDVAVKVIDVPYFRKRWQSQEGLFSAADEQTLRSLRSAAPDEGADVTLRISIPFDFSPSRSRRTFVFGTSETQVLREEQFLDPKKFEQLQQAGPPPDIRVVTPSRWSAEAYYKAGFRSDQVIIVPHGVDADTFHPMPAIRNQVRNRFFLFQRRVRFFSASAP